MSVLTPATSIHDFAGIHLPALFAHSVPSIPLSTHSTSHQLQTIVNMSTQQEQTIDLTAR